MDYKQIKSQFVLILFAILFINPNLVSNDHFPKTLNELFQQRDAYTILFQWTETSAISPHKIITGVLIEDKVDKSSKEAYYLQDRLIPRNDWGKFGIVNKFDVTQKQEVSVFSEPVLVPQGGQKCVIPDWKDTLKEVSPSGLIKLPPIPIEQLQAEEKESLVGYEKGIFRIGIVQELPVAVNLLGFQTNLGNWQVLNTGDFIWAVSIHFPNVVGIRVRIISHCDMSNRNSKVIISKEDLSPSDLFVFNVGELSKLDGWLPTVFSDKINVFVLVPPDENVDDLCLSIPEVTGIYKDPLVLLAKAGDCNLDVTCYPTWSNTSRGVAGLGVISSPYALFCTGTLLNDNDPCTQIPYVLTANHCVSSQSGNRGADTIEFYWFYQTSVCNGSPPSLLTVPRTTGGAEYLAGSSGSAYYGGGNDFTLLRMRNAPPETATFVGWSTGIFAIGTQTTCIHHPSGSFKRISFGKKTNENNPYSSLYHEVTWDEGTTEPGSSGSPLLLTATQQVIGQLWGGGASCNTPTEPDYFGRFDRTYPVIKVYLEQPVVKFQNQRITIEERTGSINIPVVLNTPSRTNDSGVSVEVNSTYAVQGLDFQVSHNLISFNTGDTQKFITVIVNDNTHTERDKSIRLTLHSPQCIQLDSVNTVYEITILDDDLDTDGDGLSDYDELNGVFGYTSDPDKVDTDYDGLTDYDEIMGIYGFSSNPNLRDTDGDGVSDWWEARYGTDPNDPLDKPGISSLPLPWFE